MATNPDDALEQIANAPDLGGDEELGEAVIELTDDDMGGDSLADFIPEGADTQAADTQAAPAADTIEGGEGDDAVSEPPKRRARGTAQERFNELTERARQAEERAAEAEARAARAAEAEASAVRAAVFNHHAALETRAETLKAKLLEAKRNGDAELEVDLQAQFNRVETERHEAKEWLDTTPTAAPVAPPAPVEQPRPAPPAPAATPPTQVQYMPETAAWISRNTWFQQGSPDFDAELADEARLFARSVERRYKAEGKPIDSPAYFMEIDQHMRTAFPDDFAAPAPTTRGVPPMSRDVTVAPVVRGGAPAPGAPSGNSVRLDAAERGMAHQLAMNGALKKADGTRPTSAEAERMFAAQKLKLSKG